MATPLLPCTRLRTLNDGDGPQAVDSHVLVDAAFDNATVTYMIKDLGIAEDLSPLYLGGSLRSFHEHTRNACQDYKQRLHFELATERQVRNTGACPFPLLRVWERELGRDVIRSCVASTISSMSTVQTMVPSATDDAVDDTMKDVRSWDKLKLLNIVMTIGSIDTYARTMIWVDMVNRIQCTRWSQDAAEAFAAELRARLKKYSMLLSLPRVVSSTESNAKNEARFHTTVRKAIMDNVTCRTIEDDDQEEEESEGVAKKQRCV